MATQLIILVIFNALLREVRPLLVSGDFIELLVDGFLWILNKKFSFWKFYLAMTFYTVEEEEEKSQLFSAMRATPLF